MIKRGCTMLKDNIPGQSLEKLSHGHEIQLVRTVEHNTLDGDGFGQVLSVGNRERIKMARPDVR